MWLLRCARKNRWEDRRAGDPSHVAEAARDLSLRPGEEGLSLFEVADEEEGRQVATGIGVNKVLTLGRSDHVDYLLIPSEVFERLALTVVPVPDPSLEPLLSKLHREAKGITDAISLELAAAILETGGFNVNRIKKQDIEKAARGS
jgi:hypothetical protein